MHPRKLAVCWLLAICSAAPVVASVRFEGLERLYFERMDAVRAPWQATPDLRDLLPQRLAGSERVVAATADAEPDSAFRLHDIELPLAGTGGRLWLREVEDIRHPRIAQLWWALYQDGERRDVWFYSAVPARTEDKLLGNYLIESVRAPATDALLLRLRSRMLRPGGAWWIAGRELAFDVRGGVITLTRLHTPWAYTRGYDSGDAEGTLTVATEHEHEHAFLLHRSDRVSGDRIAACGLADREALTEPTQSWQILASTAQCITAAADATTSTRAFDEASFAERERGE